MRRSFWVPLDSRLRPPGIKVDLATATVEVRKWLRNTANMWVHGTTESVPAELLVEEQRAFLPLAGLWQGQVPRVAPAVNTLKTHPPGPTIQHPLSVYESVLAPRAVQ